jgi:hypothetical protein
MRTEDLIADLASRTTAVTPLASPALRFAGWSAAALASAALGLAVFGPRHGLDLVVGQPLFITTAVLGIATSAIAALAALILAIPGAERSPALRISALALLALWGAPGLAGVVRAGGFAAASDWYVCFARVLAIGVIPAWLLTAMLHRAAPLRWRYASALAALGAMALGAAEMQFICPLDDAAHTFLGHYGPALTACAFGAVVGSRGSIPKSQFPNPNR